MKKYVPWIAVAVMAVWSFASLRPARAPGFHVSEFAQLPVLLNGRIQPLDSVARNSLLQIRDKQTAPLKLHFSVFDPAKRGEVMPASQWMLELMAKPDLADTRKVFRVDHPELIDLLKLPEKDENAGEDGKHYSFLQLQPKLDELGSQYERIQRIEQAQRTPFEKQVVKLQNALMLYQRLKATIAPPTADDFAADLAEFQKILPAGQEAIRLQQDGKPYNEEAFRTLAKHFGRFNNLAEFAYVLVVPPPNPGVSRDGWESVGTNLMQTVQGGQISPAVLAYATMFSAYRKADAPAFNRALRDYQQYLRASFVPEASKGAWEFRFNQAQFFYKAMTIYVLAFLLACISWFNGSEWLRRSGFYLGVLALLLNSAGLFFRMILENRPPVTNLYSSAVFIGWGAAFLGIILERIYRDGLGTAIAGLAGFASLIVAHHLSTGGDTMEMMRAVLDSNFWLATHVVTITIGYCGCFVAGLLGIFYILRGFFTTSLTPERAKNLARMVYGIVCFATFFSFIGTVLGGIWADQSWGRFWGWDPKENGALIIVLWCAAILHARWSGLVRERGLMNMAIFGNIVTSFSWFGVNMLGVGLHSYGFMDSAFNWLMLFIASQALFIGIGLVPLKYWRSFSGRGASSGQTPPPSPPLKSQPTAA